MEYVYAALVLHEAGKEVSEDNVTAILEAGGIEVDDARVKSLVAALEDVDIEEAMAEQAAAPVAAGGGAAAGGAEEAEEPEAEEAEEEAEEPEAEEDDEDDEDQPDAGEGLGNLFG
jgi:large subunit ribosomal protein L12